MEAQAVDDDIDVFGLRVEIKLKKPPSTSSSSISTSALMERNHFLFQIQPMLLLDDNHDGAMTTTAAPL